MKIGFLNNQIDNRGTGNAVFDYASYNEEILGNESVIFTFPYGSHDREAVLRFQGRFTSIYDINQGVGNCDALYHIKSGLDDGFKSTVPYLVHSVFDNQPHGDRYATISQWMGARFGIPFVPHIVSLPNHGESIRRDVGIPDSAIVFGRHGGPDTFDIPWVWKAIQRILVERDDVWFLFMNTNRPDVDLNEKVVFVDPSVNPLHKRAFINTCDAMLHARARGETFGISVGEFAICNKPVITYKHSPEIAHIIELGPHGIYYSDEQDLYNILDTFTPRVIPTLYAEYTPEKVMVKFREVFLNGLNTGSGA